MVCAQCQEPLAPTARFCGNCGTPVPGAPPSTPRGTAPLTRGPETKPQGDRRVVTVLFTDVSGFTAMSEKLDPEEVTDIVNQFFKVLSEPIVRYGGTIDKYMGDAIMAIFGAPVAHEDDPVRAVSAAWRMQQEAQRFAAQLADRTGIRLKVRIGLNTGLVIAGAVGSEQRSDYTVMGDTVNLAQRMESAATPGKVLVTAETRNQARHAFAFVALPPIKVKGKSEEIAIYELAGPRREADEVERRLVGRDAQLAQLQKAMEQAFEGQPQLVEVVGEAGLGKSALVRAFMTSLKSWSGCQVLRGRCYSFDSEEVYALPRRLLHQWLGLPDEVAARVAIATLRERAQDVPFLDRDQAFALLVHLLVPDLTRADGVDPHAVQAMDPHDRREATFSALSELVLFLCANEPVVLSFDDVHWADEGSLGWLSALLAKLDGLRDTRLPLLVVMQRRPWEREPWVRGSGRVGTATVTVEPLSREQGLGLVGDLLGVRRVDDWPPVLRNLAAEVVERAEGNPYYLHELVRALQEDGGLVKSSRKWTPGQGVTGLPGSINGLVAARLDRLPAPAREVLGAAAVVGRQVDRPLLEELGGFADLEGGLSALVKSGVLRVRAEGTYSFGEALVQEVAYQGLLVKVRKGLHGRIAEILERHAELHLGDLAPTLARHYGAAEHPRAVVFQVKAGSYARSCYANELAARAFQDAMGSLDAAGEVVDPETPARWEVLFQLGEVETILGRYEPAEQHLREALALSPRPSGQAASVLAALGLIAEQKGDYASGKLIYEEALESVDLDDTGARVLVGTMQSRIGFIHFRQGDYEKAMEMCRHAFLLMDEADNPKELGFVCSVMGLCCQRADLAAEAIAHHRQALALRERAGDRLGVGKTLNNLGALHQDLGEHGAALGCYRRALNVSRELGDAWFQSMAQLNLGLLLVSQEAWQEAAPILEEALTLKRQLQDQHGTGLALAGLGEVCGNLGDHERALSLVREGVAVLEEIGAKDNLPEVTCTLGEQLLAVGEPAEAYSWLTRSIEMSRELGAPLREAIAYRSLSSLFLGQRRVQDALSLASRSINLMTDGANLEAARSYEQLARVLEAGGRTDLAGQARDQARARRARQSQAAETLGAR